MRSFTLFLLNAGRQLVKAYAQQFAFPPYQTPGSLSVMAAVLEARFVPAFNRDWPVAAYLHEPPTHPSACLAAVTLTLFCNRNNVPV